MLQLLSVRAFSFLFNFWYDFKCGFGFHFPPALFQKLNPKYFVCVGLVTLLFSAFTFNPSFFSIYFVIEFNTRIAAFSLLTSIIQSVDLKNFPSSPYQNRA